MEKLSKYLLFPDQFKFGTSVAAFQVEGNVSGERKTDWDSLLENNPDQIIRPGEIGPDWWGQSENVEKDLKQISELGVNMQRLSLEWARIEPEEGQFNSAALSKYRMILDICKKYKLEPIVTLNHFSLPSWVAKRGGWENAKITTAFLNYTKKVLEEFPDVKSWLIVNEPSNVVYVGHFLGIFPPNKRSLVATLKARANIIRTQKEAYTLIKTLQPESEVGNAFSFLWLRSQDPNARVEKFLTKSLNYLVNTNYISATKDHMDFLGINFYTGYYLDLKLSNFSTTMRNEAAFVPHHLPFSKTVKPKTFKTDMGWPIVPDFFLDVLRHMSKQYKKPILITENGIADRDDFYRSFYVLTHLTALWKALDEGIDIKGYIHWATLDNLEWVEGFAKRFGLIGVDPSTGARRLREGAKTYETIVKNRKINLDQIISSHIPEPQKAYANYVVEQLLETDLHNHLRLEHKS